ncbi:MAG: DUF1848 domain-containing protein [Dongiaceae bacterium]
MIVSASYRTDIPAFHGDWFMNRLDAGFCQVANPHGGKPYRVEMTAEAVDGFVFWTRNVGPFMDGLTEIRRRGLPFVVQFTITGYPRVLEPSVVDADRAIAQLRSIAERFGSRAVVWRYDPILLTSLTGGDWQRANFSRLATAIGGVCDEVVFSFADFYAKTRRNLSHAARDHGFTWAEPPIEERRALLHDLAAIARDNGLRPTLCVEPDLVAPGIAAASCIDAARLSDVAGKRISAREKGNRPGCACAESRDIGAYDSCVQGCVYCYAVRDPAAARDRFTRHDAWSEAL